MLYEFSRYVRDKKLITFACILIVLTFASCSPQAGKSLTASTLSPYASNTQSGSSDPETLLPLEYYSPLAGAQYVSKGDTIILRFGPVLDTADIARLVVSLQGSRSGNHNGRLILAADQRTVIFKPDQPFTAGENVRVQINSLSLNDGTAYMAMDYFYKIAVNQQAGAVASTAVPNTKPNSASPNDLTLPQDIPHYAVTASFPALEEEGYIFVAPFYWSESTVGSYLLILDNNGEIVYYQSVAAELSAFDFKVLPGGYLTYFDQVDAVHVVMDDHYQVAGTYPAFNGYTADLHDFLVTPDGYMFLMAYDVQTIDLSKVVPGGNPNAAVTGLVIQELDPEQNVIFQWRSWDHFALTDSTASLTTKKIDLVHGNGLALTSDGNLLLSSRNLSEITKISVKTGEIIWRLGGKNSTFRFINDEGFAYQHNIGVLPNGNITLFDNHGTDQAPAASRAVEYALDLSTSTATKVWEYIHTPPVFTDFMGNVQRLSNGNTFIGWGNAFTAKEFVPSTITEVTPENQVIFELIFDYPYVSYRAFRSPWAGDPDTPPALAFKQDESGLTLGYSWNGATRVASWDVYGGSLPQELSLIHRRIKIGFETQSHLWYLPPGECYFQVAALDKNGRELSRSPVISTSTLECPLGP